MSHPFENNPLEETLLCDDISNQNIFSVEGLSQILEFEKGKKS